MWYLLAGLGVVGFGVAAWIIVFDACVDDMANRAAAQRDGDGLDPSATAALERQLAEGHSSLIDEDFI